jgi:hypothetical protein
MDSSGKIPIKNPLLNPFERSKSAGFSGICVNLNFKLTLGSNTVILSFLKLERERTVKVP